MRDPMRKAMILRWQLIARGYDACLEAELKDHAQELLAMLTSLEEAKPVRVRFALPTFTRTPGETETMAMNIPVDRILTIPLIFQNAAGENVQGPTGGSVTVSDGSFATVTTDDLSVVITPEGAVGSTFSVNYTVGSLSTGEVEFSLVEGEDVIEPPDGTVPASVMMDLAAATLSPKPQAPTPVEPTPVEPTPAPTPVEPAPVEPTPVEPTPAPEPDPTLPLPPAPTPGNGTDGGSNPPTNP